MTRLLIHVEGSTEETFVNELLRPHLIQTGFEDVGARLVGNARLRRRRGGIRRWEGVRKDIVDHLSQDPGCIATTMVDYYGLPRGADGWPGREQATRLRGGTDEKAACVESALHADLVARMGPHFDANRFLPFVVMHEFEGLLFSDCVAFGRGIYRPGLTPEFQRIRDRFATPEEIDDSPLTAPSKRVEALMPGYEKPLFGVLAALEIGLNAIRGACPHFAAWLRTLESLVKRS